MSGLKAEKHEPWSQQIVLEEGSHTTEKVITFNGDPIKKIFDYIIKWKLTTSLKVQEWEKKRTLQITSILKFSRVYQFDILKVKIRIIRHQM